MNKLKKLISVIKRENKMDDLSIIGFLLEAVIQGTEEEELYRNMYIEAFGYNIVIDFAEELVKAMPEGEVFTMPETKEYASRIGADGPDIPPCEFYLVMNSLYSEHNQTMKKHNADDPLIYADMALDWFTDADTNRTFKYFF